MAFLKEGDQPRPRIKHLMEADDTRKRLFLTNFPRATSPGPGPLILLLESRTARGHSSS